MSYSTPHRRQSTQRTMKGFSLVEALVAMVVLAIGMLGIAGLYVESLRAGRTALTRTQAVSLAADMADRIRANRLGRAGYEKAATDNIEPETVCEDAEVCAPPQMALHDLAVWQDTVEEALPDGQCAVAVDSSVSPIMYTITVSWAETGQAARSSYQMIVRATT